MIRRPPRSTLFPTRRSSDLAAAAPGGRAAHPNRQARRLPAPVQRTGGKSPRLRSEEHTSELQSRVDLVCRLLLEKKKKTKKRQDKKTTRNDEYAREVAGEHT